MKNSSNIDWFSTRNKTWKQGSGQWIRIDEMTNTHLVNCMILLDKRIKERDLLIHNDYYPSAHQYIVHEIADMNNMKHLLTLQLENNNVKI